MGGCPPPRRQHGLLGFHQPRGHATWFSPALRRLQGEQPQARPTGFHETRKTAFFTVHAQGTHSQKPPPGPPRTPPGHCFPARCGEAWGGYGAAWAAAVPRSGNTACKVFTKHETRTLLPRDNVVLPPGYDFFESLRFFCPTIPRNSSDAARAAVRVPSGVLARPCREWMGIELAQKIRAGERMSLLACISHHVAGEVRERAVRTRREPLGARHGEKVQMAGLNLTTARGFGLGRYGLSRPPCVT